MPLNLDNIRRVVIRYSSDLEYTPIDSDTKYLLSTEDVDNFIIATIKLNHTPGINPYNKRKCGKLQFLAIEKPT